MSASETERLARRLLFEIPRHEYPNAEVLGRTLNEQPGFVYRGLKWLERHQQAERFLCPTRAVSEAVGAMPWRLTAEGALHLERLESIAASKNTHTIRSLGAFR